MVRQKGLKNQRTMESCFQSQQVWNWIVIHGFLILAVPITCAQVKICLIRAKSVMVKEKVVL